jgi:hypothetical protein
MAYEYPLVYTSGSDRLGRRPMKKLRTINRKLTAKPVAVVGKPAIAKPTRHLAHADIPPQHRARPQPPRSGGTQLYISPKPKF